VIIIIRERLFKSISNNPIIFYLNKRIKSFAREENGDDFPPAANREARKKRKKKKAPGLREDG